VQNTRVNNYLKDLEIDTYNSRKPAANFGPHCVGIHCGSPLAMHFMVAFTAAKSHV